MARQPQGSCPIPRKARAQAARSASAAPAPSSSSRSVSRVTCAQAARSASAAPAPSSEASASPAPAPPQAGSSDLPASSEASPPSPSAAPAAEAPLTKRRRLVLRLRPRGASAPATELAAPTAPTAPTPPPPRAASAALADDSAPSDLAPLEQLFFGDTEARSPEYVPTSPGANAPQSPSRADPVLARSSPPSPAYSPASPTLESMAAGLAELEQEEQERRERRLLAVGLSREAQEDRWGRVYWSPTPSPSPPPNVDATDGDLDPDDPRAVPPPRAATPVYERVVQPLTPPRRGAERHTPSPPPPERHVPTLAKVAGWSEEYEVIDLLVRVADRRYPRDWDVPEGSHAEQRLQRLVMKRLTEGCMPWPSWQCRHCADLGIPCFPSAFANPYGERSRKPGTCTACYLADRGNCVRDIRAFPGMEYPGDGTPAGQSRSLSRAARAHLTVPGSQGPGWVRSFDRMRDPTYSAAWGFALARLCWLANRRLVQPFWKLIETYVTCWDSLYSERQPHESTTVPGGPVDPIEAWVYPDDMAATNVVDM